MHLFEPKLRKCHLFIFLTVRFGVIFRCLMRFGNLSDFVLDVMIIRISFSMR